MCEFAMTSSVRRFDSSENAELVARISHRSSVGEPWLAVAARYWKRPRLSLQIFERDEKAQEDGSPTQDSRRALGVNGMRQSVA